MLSITEMMQSKDLYSRHISDMTPIEVRYVEAVLDEIIFNRKITFSKHATVRAKQRHLSLGRIHMAIRQGVVNEVQFNKYGMKFVISFATEQQRRKGYLNYVVLDIPASGDECRIVSLWNKQRSSEMKVNTDTYCGSKTYIKDANCLGLVYNYFKQGSDDTDVHRGDIVSLIRKYDKTPLDSNSESKITKFINGKLAVEQL